MDISLGRVLEAARERRVTLTSEVAGYVILLAAQQVAVERARVSAESVALDESGDVLVRREAVANELDIETALRQLLGTLIALCTSPPPAIVAVVERAPSGDLRELVVELSAALIPINHAAAHRSLARLYREARRAQGHLTDLSLPPIVEHAVAPEPEPIPRELDAPRLDDARFDDARFDDARFDDARFDDARFDDAPLDAPPRDATGSIESLAPDASELQLGELDIDVVIEAEGEASPALAAEALAAATELSLEDATAPPEATEAEPSVEPDPSAPTSVALEAPRIMLEAPRITEASETTLLDAPLRAPASRWIESRSDVDVLLDAYLAESRSVEQMLRVLRDMIGLGARPSPMARADAVISAVPR